MRTQDPANIRTDFDASLADVETAFNASEASVPNDAAKKLIAEFSFVAAATLSEGFLSDLFVAYINRNSEKFRAYLLGKMEIETKDDYAKRATQHVDRSMPHLSVEKIKDILDPTGYNVTFPTTDKMKEAAGKWLADADRVRFTSMSAQQCAMIDLIKSLRNFLAHRSQAADITMQGVLVAVDLPPELKRGNNNVADVAHTCAIQNNQCRLLHCLVRIRDLAIQCCP